MASGNTVRATRGLTEIQEHLRGFPAKLTCRFSRRTMNGIGWVGKPVAQCDGVRVSYMPIKMA